MPKIIFDDAPFTEAEIDVLGSGRLDNFHLYFPDPTDPEKKSYYGSIYETIGRMETKPDPNENTRYSTKKSNMLGKEFLDEIDTTVEEVGLTLEEIMEVMRDWHDKKCSVEVMQEFLLPIYIALRHKGFSRYDLIT